MSKVFAAIMAVLIIYIIPGPLTGVWEWEDHLGKGIEDEEKIKKTI